MLLVHHRRWSAGCLPRAGDGGRGGGAGDVSGRPSAPPWGSRTAVRPGPGSLGMIRSARASRVGLDRSRARRLRAGRSAGLHLPHLRPQGSGRCGGRGTCPFDAGRLWDAGRAVANVPCTYGIAHQPRWPRFSTPGEAEGRRRCGSSLRLSGLGSDARAVRRSAVTNRSGGPERSGGPSRSPLDPPFPPCGFAVGLPPGGVAGRSPNLAARRPPGAPGLDTRGHLVDAHAQHVRPLTAQPLFGR